MWRHLRCVVVGLRMRCASQIRRQIVATMAVCQEACARRPRQAARAFKHGSGTPHRYGCGIRMLHCHGRLLLLCATCAQATVPALGRAGHGHVLVTGSCCAPARLEMHCQSSVQSTVHGDCGLSGLHTHKASGPASDPGLRVPSHASRCTRAAGFSGANDPVARMQLYYVDVFTCLNGHLCSAYALRSTIKSSDHGGRGT
jgi:hypothetical protein